MRTTNEFLDAVKARHQLTSDYQLAKFLGVRQPTISGYRTNVRALDETMCIKVADALGIEAAHVMACIAAERAKSEAVKKAWQRAAAATATVVLGVLGAFGVLEVTGQATASGLPSLYIMSNHMLHAVISLQSPIRGFSGALPGGPSR